MFKSNYVEVVGKCVRIDVREGLSKNNAEFISVTFTVDSNGNQIKLESFAMKLSKTTGEETGAYKSLNTLFLESNALHKTIRKTGQDKSEEVQDETIVENIEDCTPLRFSNYQNFKYTRFCENSYVKDGELMKNIRIETQFPNRIDLEKTSCNPKAEFAIVGVVTKPPVLLERDEQEYVRMTVIIPIYQSAYGERQESVTLHEITVETRDPETFDFVLNEFEMNGIAYLEGEILRTIQRVELQPAEDMDDRRGFGSCKHLKQDAVYQTKIDEAFIITGGFPLDIDEDLEGMPEMNFELWSLAKKEKEQKEAEMLANADADKPKQTGFGRSDAKKEVKKPQSPKLPF